MFLSAVCQPQLLFSLYLTSHIQTILLGLLTFDYSNISSRKQQLCLRESYISFALGEVRIFAHSELE